MSSKFLSAIRICVTAWQIMERTERCVTVAESEATTIVATRYHKFGDSVALRQLARDVIRWECRPYPSMKPPPLAYFMKLITEATVVLPIFRYRHLLNRHLSVINVKKTSVEV